MFDVPTAPPRAGIRLGLCCQFAREPIRFRTTTAAALRRLPRAAGLARLAALIAENISALRAALAYCVRHDIGAFRVGSGILPVKTHPTVGYRLAELPGAAALRAGLRGAGRFARAHDIRLTLHPDQFVVLGSPDADVTRRSLAELAYQGELAALLGADVINLHAGGGYGDKPAALARLAVNLRRLPARVRARLTLENDDRVFTPADLLPFCRQHGVPLVYDVHHHRCLPDGLSVETVTRRALATWRREPLFHVSSPRQGWAGAHPERHHDHVAPRDVPACWRGLRITMDVEAKAKELAVRRLQKTISGHGRKIFAAKRRKKRK